MEIIKASLMAALHSSGGGANLGSVTFTENDTFTPTAPLDGWDEVTVNVPTYEDEYRRMKECCDEVKEAVGLDPEDPTITPEEVVEAVEDAVEKEGYTFPDDTPYDPTILDAVGTDPITDVNTGQTLYCEFRTAAESIQHQKGVEAWYTDSNGDVYQIMGDYDGDPDIYFDNCKITMHDPTTGTVHITYRKRSYTYPDYHFDADTYQTVSDLIGYGASGHTYKVHNN